MSNTENIILTNEIMNFIRKESCLFSSGREHFRYIVV